MSDQEQKEVLLAVFAAGNTGVNQSMETSNAVKRKSNRMLTNNVQNSNYPINNDFEYDYPDSKGGNIHMTIDTGGYISYSDDQYPTFLGAFLMINVSEKITDFHVELTNGREVILSTNQDIVFSGSFYINSDYSFDTSKTFFRIEGTYLVNGISYDLTLIGNINADGSCSHISGVINGISVSYDF